MRGDAAGRNVGDEGEGRRQISIILGGVGRSFAALSDGAARRGVGLEKS